MSYQVLARKWRPRTFAQVCGQHHVLTPLIQALDHKRLHHAYLFSGTRGVGKTTLGRLLAKGLNCEQGVSSTPCGVCDTCREIDAGASMDLIEVDAASRTKVEDTRELLDNVQYRPVRSRYKVYLIDEAHMLSRHSFNALLKTLEEPPEHVKFILATTEPNKLPATVVSRCLQFHLKILTLDQITQQFSQILAAEKIESASDALTLLAQAAQGSMRDGLSLLDQALSYNTKHLETQTVVDMLGVVHQMHLHQLLDTLVQADAAAALAKVHEIAALGPDFDVIHAQLERLLHRIALAQCVPETGTAPDSIEVARLAELLSPEDVQLFYQIVLHGRRDLPYAPDLRSGFEMTILRLLAFEPKSYARTQPPTPNTLPQTMQNNSVPHKANSAPIEQSVQTPPQHKPEVSKRVPVRPKPVAMPTSVQQDPTQNISEQTPSHTTSQELVRHPPVAPESIAPLPTIDITQTTMHVTPTLHTQPVITAPQPSVEPEQSAASEPRSPMLDDLFMERIIQKRKQLQSARQAEAGQAPSPRRQPQATSSQTSEMTHRPAVVREDVAQAPVAQKESFQPVKKPQSAEVWINAANLRGMARQIVLDSVLTYTEAGATLAIAPKYRNSCTPEQQKSVYQQLQAVNPDVNLQITFAQEIAADQTLRHVHQQRKRDKIEALQVDIAADPKLNALLKPFDGMIDFHTLHLIDDHQ